MSHSGARLLLLVAVAVTGLQFHQSPHQLLTALVLTLLLVGLLLVTVGPGRRWRITGAWADPARVAPVVVALSVVVTGFQLADPVAVPLVGRVALAASYTLLGLLACRAPRGRGTAWFLVFLLAHAALTLVALHAATPIIDVKVFLHDGVHALLSGHDPFGGSIANPYSPARTDLYWAPSLIEGNRILVGFPYLPGLLVAEVPGYLLGDPRLGHLAALLLLAVLLRRLATDDAGRALALLAVASPLATGLTMNYLVEPVVMLALGLLVLAVRRGTSGRGALSLALLLASKQYVVVMLPVLLIVRRRLGLAPVLAGTALAIAVTSAFLAADPGGFWHDVVTVQLLQPYRPDSISLLVAVGNTWGRPPEWVTGALPLVAGLLVSTLVAVRTRSGATATALCVGLSLMATVLLSKQAFPNYYALVQAALVMASITWPGDDTDPTITRTPVTKGTR